VSAKKEINTMMHAKTKLAGLACLMFACGAVVASLAFAHPPQAVEHAPTVEQCRADRAYWFSKLEQPDNHGADDETFDTLTDWYEEMFKCQAVDPPNLVKYDNTGAEAQVTQMARLMNFLKSHNLWNQFKAEDAAGKR
jgi:hypothetical protein